MKKFSIGYTLAEVLITLGIIGIVAAIVLPRLLGNTSNSVNAASVARAVELTQNGISNIFQEVQNQTNGDTIPENLASIQLRDIFEGGGEEFLTDEDNLFSSTMGLMNTEEVDDYSINNIRNYSGNTLDNTLLENTHAYRFKKTNSVVIFQNIPEAGIANAENDDVIARIFIDANGSAEPNQTGRDVFLFGLTNNGHIVPAGSDAFNKNIFGSSIELFQNGCQEDIVDGLSCAARIVADKWTINY